MRDNIYCYAICHDDTERWLMVLCDNTNTIGWTDDLFLADVWFPSDFDAGDFPDMPVNTHLVALTWEGYCRLMEDRPEDLDTWFKAIDEARTA